MSSGGLLCAWDLTASALAAVDGGRIAMDALLVAACAVAAVSDIRTRRVPNALTYPLAASGLALNTAMHPGGLGIVPALLGCSIGFLPLFAGYLAGAVGGGDAKLGGAVGAFLGPTHTAFAMLYTCLAGLLMALVVLVARDGFSGVYVRLLSPRGTYDGVAAKPLRFPFAVALFVGTVWSVVETHVGGSLWDGLARAWTPA